MQTFIEITWYILYLGLNPEGKHDVIKAMLSQEVGKHAWTSKWAMTIKLIKLINWLDYYREWEKGEMRDSVKAF